MYLFLRRKYEVGKITWNILFYTGFGLLIISILFSGFFSETLPAGVISFINGFAIAIMLVGLTFLILNRYSPEGAKQHEIEEKDERNIKIREKAGYASWYASLGIFAVLAFVFLIMGYHVIAYITVGGAVLHRVFFEIFKAIYRKKM